MVPAPATCSGCHGAHPMACQYISRLWPGPSAVITDDWPTWATEGVEKRRARAGYVVLVPGLRPDGLPEEVQPVTGALNAHYRRAPHLGHRRGERGRTRGGYFLGMPRRGPDGLPEKIDAAVSARDGNDGGVADLCQRSG